MSQKLILITTILWTEAGSAAAKEKCNETNSLAEFLLVL